MRKILLCSPIRVTAILLVIVTQATCSFDSVIQLIESVPPENRAMDFHTCQSERKHNLTVSINVFVARVSDPILIAISLMRVANKRAVVAIISKQIAIIVVLGCIRNTSAIVLWNGKTRYDYSRKKTGSIQIIVVRKE